MMMHPVILQVPDSIYQRLKRRAQETERTVEAEALDVLATAVPSNEELPPELAETLSGLSLLNDQALWQAARSHLSAETVKELEWLNLKQQREGLTESEAEQLDLLIYQYERVILVRAQAAVLLKERGYDISSLQPGQS
jgi:plasmid stability protein